MLRRLTTMLSLLLAMVMFGAAGASAQNADTADHPIVGAWMTTTPGGLALSIYHADGTFITAFTANVLPGLPNAAPEAVTFQGTQVGVWEPTGPQSVHVTAAVLQSDAAGAFIGSFTFDGLQAVSEDGQTLTTDDGGTATWRDAQNNVVLSAPAGAGVVTGTRMRVGSPGFPEASPAASSNP
jgi:hypothetical protein